MNCWHCGHDLIWGSDSDWEDTEGNQCLVSYFSCSNCTAFVEIYLPNEEEEDE